MKFYRLKIVQLTCSEEGRPLSIAYIRPLFLLTLGEIYTCDLRNSLCYVYSDHLLFWGRSEGGDWKIHVLIDSYYFQNTQNLIKSDNQKVGQHVV